MEEVAALDHGEVLEEEEERVSTSSVHVSTVCNTSYYLILVNVRKLKL